jgi:hypothetical protein
VVASREQPVRIAAIPSEQPAPASQSVRYVSDEPVVRVGGSPLVPPASYNFYFAWGCFAVFAFAAATVTLLSPRREKRRRYPPLPPDLLDSPTAVCWGDCGWGVS